MPYVPFLAHVPQLETVTIKLYLPKRHNEWKASMTVTGESSLKRGSLWSHSESWPDPLDVTGYSLTDAVAHVAMIAVQDQPATQEMFNSLLLGGKQYENQQLPF